MNKIRKLFVQHPESVGMNYAQHFIFALSLAWALFKAVLASLLHAIFPFCLKTYTSRRIAFLNEMLSSRLRMNESGNKLTNDENTLKASNKVN